MGVFISMVRKKDIPTGKDILIVVLLVVVGIAVTVIFLSAIVGVIYSLNSTGGGVQFSTMMTTVGMWVMVPSILFSCVFCNCPIVSPAQSENFAILGGICAIIGAF